MRYLLFFTLLISMLTPISLKAQNANLESGKQAIEKSEYVKAIAYLNEAIKEEEDNESAYLLRSRAHYAIKDYEKAIKDSEKVLNIKPEVKSEIDYMALWSIAVAYNSAMKFEQALVYIASAKKMKTHDIRLYENAGYSYLGLGKFDHAMKEFEAMTKLDKDSFKGYYGMGKAYFLKGMYEEAVGAFDRAIALYPDYMMAYQNRGAAKMELGDMKGGCEDWQTSYSLGAVALAPYLKEFCK